MTESAVRQEAKIETYHPQYDAEMWEKCRLVSRGGDAVKKAGRKYLPQLTGQDEERYQSYKQRSMFYDATMRTVQGLMGAIFRRPFDCDPHFKSMLYPILRKVTRELLVTGRVVIWVDVNRHGLSYLSIYRPEDLVNWKKTVEDGKERCTMAVFREHVEKDHAAFEHRFQERFRVVKNLRLSGSGERGIEVESFLKTENEKGGHRWILERSNRMTSREEMLDEMPLIVLSPRGIELEVQSSPILGLVNTNLSHYMSSADLENGRHYTGLPTAWVAGFHIDPTQSLSIGSETAWVTDNPNAKAGFLEFTGQGLGSLERALESKEKLMAVLGARLLEDQRVGVEAAETARIRQAGESATLADIVQAVEQGISHALEWVNQFDGTRYDTKVRLNDDFSAARMSAGDVKALVQAWQLGAVSHETLLENFKRGEILRADKAFQDEIQEILDRRIVPPQKSRFELGDAYVTDHEGNY